MIRDILGAISQMQRNLLYYFLEEKLGYYRMLLLFIIGLILILIGVILW